MIKVKDDQWFYAKSNRERIVVLREHRAVVFIGRAIDFQDTRPARDLRQIAQQKVATIHPFHRSLALARTESRDRCAVVPELGPSKRGEQVEPVVHRGTFNQEWSGSTITFPIALRSSSMRIASTVRSSGKRAPTCGCNSRAASMASRAARFSRPRSGKRRPYSPARMPITEKALISGMLTEIVGMRPLVKPTTSSRPSKAMQRVGSSKTSPPTGS